MNCACTCMIIIILHDHGDTILIHHIYDDHRLISLYSVLFLHSCSYGGWVVDGFPLLREQWNAMVESGIIPDAVINIEAEEGGSKVLMRRYCDANDIPYPEEKEKTTNTEGAEDGGNKVSTNTCK